MRVMSFCDSPGERSRHLQLAKLMKDRYRSLGAQWWLRAIHIGHGKGRP